MTFGAQSGLAVDIIDGVLRISIGIKRLTERLGQCQGVEPTIAIVNLNRFAKAVKLQLIEEAEDGSTPVTELLDKACLRAIEAGSHGVEDLTR